MTRQVMDSAAPGLLNPVEIKETGDCAIAWDTAHLFSVFFTLQLLPHTKVTFIACSFTHKLANVCHWINWQKAAWAWNKLLHQGLVCYSHQHLCRWATGLQLLFYRVQAFK
jgi:hypothetical protein